MKYLALLLLLACAGLNAQNISVTSSTGAPKFIPKPLQCGKYQHEVPEHDEDCSTGGVGGVCFRHVEAYCVDDIHTVTEREWQELMARLKALELSKPTLPSDVVATPAANGYPPEKKP